VARDLFQKLTPDTNRWDHDDNSADEAGTKRRDQFRKRRKRRLAVQDIEIPNSYRPLDYDKFPALLDDIRDNGIEQRIEVSERGTRYVLEHGRARLEAAKRLKLETIRAFVLGDYRPVAKKKEPPKEPLPNEWQLVKQARGGDIDARNQLVEHYYLLGLKLTRQAGERSDHNALVFDAICKAIHSWDPKKGKLSTLIGWKVRGELTALYRERKDKKREKRDESPTWQDNLRAWLRRHEVLASRDGYDILSRVLLEHRDFERWRTRRGR
jgi:hypothetical protein